jgi:PAS domain S-box-containing protein
VEESARLVRERLAIGEVEVLRLVAAGEPLAIVLDALVSLIEKSSEGTIGSVLLVDRNGRLRHGAGSRLPRDYVRSIDGEAIGPVAGSCGTAAYRRETVVVEDIATDPLWAPYREAALGFGLRACWSVPVLGEGGAVIGTFALYDTAPRKPTPDLLALAHHASVIASLAIQRHLKDALLAESEARAQLIIDTALDAHVMIDQHGVVRSWRPRAEEIFGFSAERALGRRLADLIVPPAERAAHAAGIARFLATGEGRILGRRIEVEAMHQRGHLLPVELAVTKIVDGDETLFSAFISDLSARRAAEASLRENDKLMHAAYENAADVLFHLTVEEGPPRAYRFAVANPAFYKTTGLMPDQLIGKTVDEIIPEPSRTAVLAEYAEAIASRQPRRWMEVTRYPAGEKHGEVTVTPVFDDKGKAVALVGSVHDMTGHIRMERELRDLQRAEIVGRLSAGVAHDFNNILSVVLLGAEMLEHRAERAGGSTGSTGSTGPTGASNPVADIVEAGQAGTRLTRQFLALSRRQRVDATLVDVGQVVNELTPMLRRLLREGVTLDLELTSELTLVTADPVQLEQALINLVVNARDAIVGAGTITVRTARVELDAAAAHALGAIEPGPHVVLSVADTGSGMSDDVKKRVFEPFFTTKAPGRGTGLGLATVDGFARQAAGLVTIDTKEGAGTTFTIYLPPGQGRKGVARAVRRRRPVTETASVGRVLVVEDDPPLRRMLGRVLEQLHYEVETAGSADEARTALRKMAEKPELLVTDTVLPGANGVDFVHELLATTPALRVLFVSGYPEEREVEERARAADDRVAYLDKPFSIAELADAIHDLTVR